MNARRIGAFAGVAAAASAALLVGAGIAQAADEDETEGYNSTQSPTQGADAGAATLDNAHDSFSDAANGDNRPNGANGTETEFFDPDSRFVEGPLGGMLKNGPLE